MLRLPLIASITVLLYSGVAQSSQITESDVVGSWQVGLVGDARNIAAGLAFKKGITAAVFTFNPDKSLRAEMPCREETFIREHGEFLLTGSWELRDENTLIQVREYRGIKRTETSSVSLDSGNLVQVFGDGRRIKLGPFTGNLEAVCEYE